MEAGTGAEEISGLPHVCLQPSAGSHGELAGVLLTCAYHEARGEKRHKVLTPDTAHGTNPATVTMAGFEVVKIATNPDGGVDLEDLRAKADTDVACLMLTNPNTLGLFDANIQEIAKIVHEVGATLYYDGANLNAVMGLSRPGDMGFDIVHFNLHKSFTQPTAAADQAPGRSRYPTASSRSCRCRGSCAREGSNGSGPRFDLRRGLARCQVDRASARLPRQLRLLRALLRLHLLARRPWPEGRLRDGGAERQLPARAVAPARRERALPLASATCACTSSCSPAAR